jgi:hypothetical protein
MLYAGNLTLVVAINHNYFSNVLQPVAARKRTKIETVELTLEQALVGEDVDELIKGLNKFERKLLEDMLREVREHGTNEQLQNLWKVDYLRKPPTMKEFVDDGYWLGESLLPTEENPGLFPTWKEILVRDFDLDSRIHNVVVTGSLGIGKTFVSAGLMLYKIVLASLLRNPQNFVGLSKSSKISFVIMSVTRAAVGLTAFGDAMTYMGNSAYFREELGFDPERKYGAQMIDLGRGIRLIGGSKSQHIVGQNTLGVMLDEGNARLEANPDVRAYKLYDEIRTRIKNRFQKTVGFLPAISILASSAKDETSVTERVMNEIRKNNNPKQEAIYSSCVYRIKSPTEWRRLGATEHHIQKHARAHIERWFKVSHGIKNVPPRILQGWYYEDGRKHPTSTSWETATTGTKIELVPEDYLQDYERDIIDKLQSISGISIGGSYKLFNSMTDIDTAIENGAKLGVVNPASEGVELIPLSEEDDRQIWDYLDHPKFLQRNRGQIMPKRHPGSMRFGHMDLATRSMAGLSICHMVGYETVSGLIDKATGKVYEEARLIVEYDFILSLVSGKIKPISFEKIQNFFLWLRDRCGYNFGLITADTWQSIAQLQMLENRGFVTGSLSLDRSKEPYYALRAGFEEERILMYKTGVLYNELENLVDGPKMIDHANAVAGDFSGSTSKDVADSLGGSFMNCVSATEHGLLHGTQVPIESDAMRGSINAESDAPPIEIQIVPQHRQPRKYTV